VIAMREQTLQSGTEEGEESQSVSNTQRRRNWTKTQLQLKFSRLMKVRPLDTTKLSSKACLTQPSRTFGQNTPPIR